MLQVVPQQRIYLAVEPVDFRKGVDGLAALCRQKLQQDPLSGALFLFTNRSRTSVKVLVYDGDGMWLCLKRLSQGRFRWWPEGKGAAVEVLAARQLQILLWNGNPERADLAPLWRPLAGSDPLRPLVASGNSRAAKGEAVSSPDRHL
jgi:transposase